MRVQLDRNDVGAGGCGSNCAHTNDVAGVIHHTECGHDRMSLNDCGGSDGRAFGNNVVGDVHDGCVVASGGAAGHAGCSCRLRVDAGSGDGIVGAAYC